MTIKELKIGRTYQSHDQRMRRQLVDFSSTRQFAFYRYGDASRPGSFQSEVHCATAGAFAEWAVSEVK